MDDSSFIPEFTFKNYFGLFSVNKSLLNQYKNITYISIYNKLYAFKNKEVYKIYGTLKYLITSFSVSSDFIVIGYDNGFVEYINNNESKILRLHKKKIIDIFFYNDLIISSSKDNFIKVFDITLETLKRSINTLNSIKRIKSYQNLIYCCLNDNSFKIYDLNNENFTDLIKINESIFDFLIKKNELFILLNNNKTLLYNLINKNIKNFDSFKKMRNVIKNDQNVAIQTEKNIFMYKITKEDTFGLVFDKKIENKKKYTKFDFYEEKFIFLTTSNKIEILNEKYNSQHHENEIIQIEIKEDKIYSLSKEKLILWTKSKNKLNFISKIDMKNCKCFNLFNDFVLIATNEDLNIFDQNFFLIKKITTKEIKNISVFKDFFSLCFENKVNFYDKNFNLFNNFTLPDISIFSAIVEDLFIVSCMDSKIYIYNIPSNDLKLTLYGHSLPVRSFSVCPKNNSLISCGADKLVKVWGLEFGDCKKTFVGDSFNSEFYNEDIFFYFNEKLIFNRKLKRLKDFNTFEKGFIKFGSDFFITSCKFGLCLFLMNREEFFEEDSEEIENLILNDTLICNYRNYDRFLGFIEKIEKNPLENKIEFYKFLEKTDFIEIKDYLYVLDFVSVNILIDLIFDNINQNLILNLRIFINLLKNHREIVLSNKNYFHLKKIFKEKIKNLKEKLGENISKIEIDLNKGNNIEY